MGPNFLAALVGKNSTRLKSGERIWNRHCRKCDVRWNGTPPCWFCGEEALFPEEKRERENAANQEVT